MGVLVLINKKLDLFGLAQCILLINEKRKKSHQTTACALLLDKGVHIFVYNKKECEAR